MPQNSGVDTKHPLYMRNLASWQRVKDCVAGEDQIKYRGELYLPHPVPGETKSPEQKVREAAIERYKNYKSRARFLNATGRTKTGMLGVAFSKPVEIALSGGLSELETNADGKGQPLTQVIRNMLGEVLESGRGMLIPDFTGSGEQTATTQGQLLLRFFTADQIINWRETGDKTTMVVVKWKEDQETGTDDFQLYERWVWLELRMVDGVAHARKWHEDIQSNGKYLDNANKSGKTPLAPLRDLNGSPITELPAFWLGSENNDATPDPAPLADIASLNIGHYQADANVCEIAHLASNPTLAISGLTQAWAEKYLKHGCKVGATTGILLNENAKAEIIQANDTNGNTLLKETRAKEMAMLGAKLIERGTGAKTATQASFEAQTDNSILSLCAGNVEKCVNAALRAAAMMVNGKGEVGIAQQYDVATIDAPALTALMAMVQNGTLSLHNFIRYQQSIGLISDEKTPEQIEAEIRDQAPLPGLDLMGHQMDLVDSKTQTDNQNDDGKEPPAKGDDE